MKIALIFSGKLRTLFNNVNTFFYIFQSHQISLYIHISPKDKDTKYIDNDNIIIEKILKLPFLKNIVINYDTYENLNNSQKQWTKLYEIWKTVKSDYDLYIRLRPDIVIYERFDDFIDRLDINKINIPVSNHKNMGNYLNDQIAIGNYENMNNYCRLIEYSNIIDFSQNYPEKILFQYYDRIKLLDTIHNIELNYKIMLSNVNIFAICGDSGCGKSTFYDIISPIIKNKNHIKLETDRYHKWERGNENWNLFTHLNPQSNNLEKMEEDIFNLKLGNDIFSVDYDHDTGKFTQIEKIESKSEIIVVGLHTLFNNPLNFLYNFRIYIDTDNYLKKYWKVSRDMKYRGYTYQKSLEQIEKRQADFFKYIETQKDNADVIIQYYSNQLISLNNIENCILNHLEPVISINIYISNYFYSLIKEKELFKKLYEKSEHANNYFKIFLKSNVDIINITSNLDLYIENSNHIENYIRLFYYVITN